MKDGYKVLIGVAIVIFALVKFCGNGSSNDSNGYFVYDNQYESFVGTYVVDLTIAQSGHMTTIVLNPDGTGYFQEGDSYKSVDWWPADNGGGIRFSGGGSNEQSCYYMNKQKTLMFWGLNNYMGNKDGFRVNKTK